MVARDRTVIEKMKHYFDRSESLEVDIDEFECCLLGPNELDVDIRYARGEQQQRLFHTLSQKGTSDFLVATVARWDEHERLLVIQEKKCQDLCQAVEQMSERQELLVAMMERKKIMQREAPEEFQKQILQEIKS